MSRPTAEPPIADLGRLLLLSGAVLALAGGALLLADRFGVPRLPGDIVVQRGPVTVFFPLAPSLLVSLVLTLLLNWWLRRT